MFWLVNSYDFYLVELMQTVKSAHILTIRTSLSAEACRISTTLDRQVFLVENNISEDICHRYLGSRDEVKVIEVTMVHLSFFVRKLTCAISGSLIHYIWWLYFQITALASLFKEESLKCSLQASHLSEIDRESGTGNLYAEVKVYKVVFLAQIPMAHSVLRQIRHYTTFFHNHVVRSILSLWNIVVRDIWNRAEQLGKLLLYVVEFMFKKLRFFLQRSHTFLDSVGFLFLSFLHECTNLCRLLLALL